MPGRLLPEVGAPGIAEFSKLSFAALVAVSIVACDGQEPLDRQEAPPPGERLELVRTSGLVAGPATVAPPAVNPYEGDERALMDGERLYGWFNCAGCHGAAGGDGIGPPFADEDWIYGDDPAAIYQSIIQGRPQGMPTFAGMIPEDQVWKIAAFVRSLELGEGGGPEEASGS